MAVKVVKGKGKEDLMPLKGEGKGGSGGGENLDDERLAFASKGGDKEAFARLVERYWDKAFRLALTVVSNRDDAEEVVQESFVKAYLGLGKFQGRSSFSTWFFRIVYNMALDYWRKFSRDKGRLEEKLNNEGEISSKEREVKKLLSAEDPLFRLEKREELRRAREVLDSLSEEHRAVLLLREVEGLSYYEIAKVLGIPKGTVMSRLYYAREAIRKLREGEKG